MPPRERSEASKEEAAVPLSLADKIRKVGEERQLDSGLVVLLLAIADELPPRR